MARRQKVYRGLPSAKRVCSGAGSSEKRRTHAAAKVCSHAIADMRPQKLSDKFFWHQNRIFRC